MSTLRILHLVAILLLILSWSQQALAIGDSGGCGNVRNSPLGKAVIGGTPEEVVLAIREFITNQERDRKHWDRLETRRKNKAPFDWQERMTRLVIEGNYPPGFCGLGSLLRIAANAGNVEVVSYFLEPPISADPNDAFIKTQNGTILSTIFMDCQHNSRMTDSQRERRLMAFQRLLEAKGSNINIQTEYGVTALRSCHEPELVRLYLTHGADPNIGGNPNDHRTVLEIALVDAIQFLPGSEPIERLKGLDRARVFAEFGIDSIIGRPVEKYIDNRCNDRDGLGWHKDTCKTLSTFIKATPGVFGTD